MARAILNLCLIPVMLFSNLCTAKITKRQQDNNLPVISEKPDGFEVLHLEHEISEKNAREVLRNLKPGFFKERPSYCKHSVKCTDEVQRYCNSQQILNDHCCCDHSHRKDKFPWLPHTCYVSSNGCKMKLGACSTYEERRECCCEKMLAKQYQEKLLGITSGAGDTSRWPTLMLLLVGAFGVLQQFS